MTSSQIEEEFNVDIPDFQLPNSLNLQSLFRYLQTVDHMFMYLPK